MFKKIKQLFCKHRWIMSKDNLPFYLSVGDEFQDRKSTRYYMYCCKCDKEMDIIKRWTDEK